MVFFNNNLMRPSWGNKASVESSCRLQYLECWLNSATVVETIGMGFWSISCGRIDTAYQKRQRQRILY